MGIMAGSTPTGGWTAVNEAHSNGLITSDFSSRKPVGQIAERAPSLEDGSISLLPDGRMRVTYTLRKGVTWQDGAPFTARDLVFSYRFNNDAGIPNPFRDAISLMTSVEAPNDQTFIVEFKGPYYLGGSMGVRMFWPQPEHLLGEAYERYLTTKNADDVVNLPYWTSEYVHLGPFRLTSFDPSEGIAFEAYDGYFAGRPKVDVIRVRLFGDQNALFSNLLAGTVDVFLENTLQVELGTQLKERWDGNGEGTVHVKRAGPRLLALQWRSAVQVEPAVFDQRVRAALYHALDREALSEGLQSGLREMAAWGLLAPGHLHFEATRDGLRPYAYDVERARSLLADAGWAPAGDGTLRNRTDGRRFRAPISAPEQLVRELPAYADAWRRLGIEVEEISIPPAQTRNLEFRALFPGWEVTGQPSGDGILLQLEGPAAAPQTRWFGNRSGYEDARAMQLLEAYRTSLDVRQQFQAAKALGDFVAAEVPFLFTYSSATHLGVRKGVQALDDHDGGDSPGGPYGTWTRNAHLWQVL